MSGKIEGGTINIPFYIILGSNTSRSSAAKYIPSQIDISSTGILHIEDRHDHLNNYLSQLSQPPETISPPDQIKDSKDVAYDTSINKDGIVTSSKNIDGICLQKLSLEEQDDSNSAQVFQKDIYKETSTEPSANPLTNEEPSLKISDSKCTNGTNYLIQNKDCLSTQIKKLSNAVQSEADLIQRRIFSLEDSMSIAKTVAQPKELLQINIPNSTVINNNEPSTTISDPPKSNIISPGMSSIG